MLNRRQMLGSVAGIGIAAVVPGQARAAGWPERNVNIIVPFGPGGGADILGRYLAEELARDLNGRFLILNKPGLSGSLGVDFAAKQPPDGYTFVIVTVGGQITNPWLFKSLPYDPVKDIVPVVHLSTPPNIMVVGKDVPATNVAEFITWAKKQSEPVLFANTGSGSSSGLSAELFRSMSGIKITQVTYKSSAEAALDLITGRVTATIDSLTSMIAHVRSGKLTLLGAATMKRLRGYESVPTINETLAGFDASPILYISAPTGTPREAIDTLNKAVNKIFAKQQHQDKLYEYGFPVGGGTPGELQAIIDSERVKWKAVIESAGLMGSAT